MRRQLEDVKSANLEGRDDPDSAELSNVFDHESCPSGSDDSVSQAVPCQGETQIETSSKKRRLRMMDEDSDGVRIKIIPRVRQQFRRRMEATKVLDDDFYVPNRAQLMLSFLQKHGARIVQETPGPRKRFPSTLMLVQHVLQKSPGRSSAVNAFRHVRMDKQELQLDSPRKRGVCVCVHPDSNLGVLAMTC